MNWTTRAIAVLAVAWIATTATAVPSLIEPLADGVWEVRDDQGNWGGMTGGMGITHQNSATYQARKILDLSEFPAADWATVQEVRLAVFFMVRDYSVVSKPPANGLDEAYQVVVNGNVHEFPTGGGAPVYAERGPATIAWHDTILPKSDFVLGVNEIIIRKAPSEKNDDYLYLGIDTSIQRGNSSVSFDSVTWTQDRLTIPGGNGEYMVRLHLLAAEATFDLVWQPAGDPVLHDPAGIVLYAGARDAQSGDDGLFIPAGASARVEWRAEALDGLRPAAAEVSLAGTAKVAWLDRAGQPLGAVDATATARLELPAGRRPEASGIQVTAGAEPVTLRRVELQAGRAWRPVPEPLNLTPAIAPVKPLAEAGPPRCELTATTAELSNDRIRARFSRGDRLRLESLFNLYSQTEMARQPDAVALFLVEVGEERFAGTGEFACVGWEAVDGGFRADLRLPAPALAAALTVTCDREGLRLALAVRNAGEEPVDFKLAFPHLAGLAVSPEPADDYYYYPSGGGIIADRPVVARRGYGDYEALYQVMDLYGPATGAGVYLRVDDPDGWHKIMALRKHLPGQSETNHEILSAKVKPEYLWRNPLAAVPGTGLAVEYLRRTRPPGTAFEPPPAVLATHPGDWHTALATYADWAHRVHTYRPFPSRLHSVHTMMAAGWAKGFLFRDGAYRTDIITPRMDCVELMSWWDWSPRGPFGLPFDQLGERLSEATIKRWQPYFVTDPVTGEMMWNNQPGDYRGYNERFGGLPAFRQAIETYRGMGPMVTLYTDPFRLCGYSSETGRQFGEAWGVVGVDGKKTTSYEVTNPCHDLPEVREWVAREMGRVMRETGADGIRLDEYGHRGWACYDPTHQHTFAEPGITQWMKATAEATRLVREAMDAIDPTTVLTAEFPGNDHLMQYLDGCITYDLTGQGSPLRPLEVNTQRFYFPACKPYELDHLGVDRQDNKKFWNAVGSFGRIYPLPYYTILRQNEAVYGSGDAYPLLVTPGAAPQVYVNRFRGAGRTIYHLFNATGHTFDGVALTVNLLETEHLFDLLACRPVTGSARADGLGRDIRVYLNRGEPGCLIQLTRQMRVAARDDGLLVEVAAAAGELVLQVAAADGQELLSSPALPGGNRLDLSSLPAGTRPACVKLLSGGELVDIAALP